MEKKMSKAKFVLLTGVVGMLGALITMISDFILLAKPSDAYLFLKMGTESMADIAQWRITAGVFLGIIALPFQLLGLIPVYHGLRPSGKVMPVIVVITAAHALIMGVAFHISYAFIGSGWHLYYENGVGNSITTEMIDRFSLNWSILIMIMFTELLFCSIMYAITILKRNTLYPRWMALFNPLCIVIAMFPVVFLLPSPIGGVIAPAYLNLSTLLFLWFSTIVIYKKQKGM